jgi:PKHD-type hydroxylase
MFLSLPGLLAAEPLAAVRAALNESEAPWVDGRVTAGHQGILVKKNEQIEESSAVAAAAGKLVIAALERNASFISAALPHRVYPPIFNRYGEGMHFGPHVDGAIRMLPGTAQRFRTDLSATVFLSAPDSYDGGELVIEVGSGFGAGLASGPGTDIRSFKLAAGDMVLYPATSRHWVTPVTRGVRLACFFWVQSMVRDDAQRAQLFELDGVIRHLAQTNADTDSVVRLTNHYHNLLRRWSAL